jgi:hypothetical protein
MAALVSSFLLLVALAARYLGDTDLGYHLSGGRWIADHVRFFSKDVFTYTRSSADYIDLHWLYQILIYAVYRLGGYTFLSLFNIVLIAAVFGVTLRRLQITGAPLWMCVPLLSVALMASEVRFHVRPEILTWLFMGLMLWVLETWRTTRRQNVLWLLPLIQVIWTNCEGLFGIGWGLMGFYLISDLVHSTKIDKTLWRLSAAAIAASLINPYFIRGAMLPFTYLATLDAASPFKQTIAEFQSPWTMGNRFTYPALTMLSYQTYCAFLLVPLLATLRKRQVHELLLAGVFFYLSATAFRNIPLFLLATLPVAAASWEDVTWPWLVRLQDRTLRRPAAAWTMALTALALALRAVTSAHYVSEGRLDRFGLGLSSDSQPARGAEFLVRNRLDGRILNQVNTGGWLDWTRPGQVFVDGRTEVMGEDLWVESIASSKPGGLARAIARYHPDILFFNPLTALQWITDLKAMADWHAVYVDETVCIFLRTNYAPQVPALDADRVLADRGLSRDVGESLSMLQEPTPSLWARSAGTLFMPAVHPNGIQSMAFFFEYRGDYQASEALFLEGLRLSRGAYDDLYLNLGLMYYRSGQDGKARLCMERVLRNDPGNETARRILSDLDRFPGSRDRYSGIDS